MNSRVKRKLPVFFLAGFILLAAGTFFFSSEPVTSKENGDITPTLFIHGFGGTENSFGRMIDRFENNQWAEKSFVINVSQHGRLFVRGRLSQKQNPMIQVLFAHNRASIERQTEWLGSVLKTLHEKHHIQTVHLVAHSMGGLASANHLLNNQAYPLPEVKKLVTIGSPFLGIERERYASASKGSGAFDLQWLSPALKEMTKNRALFDEQTKVLNIAGVINGNRTGSDGLVTLQSARGLKKMVPSRNYNEQVFYNQSATHTGLHELPKVDQAVADFLWDIQ